MSQYRQTIAAKASPDSLSLSGGLGASVVAFQLRPVVKPAI